MGASGVGILFVSPQGGLVPHSFTIAKHCSNNIAEYQVVIMGMEIALAMGIRCLEIFRDSKLIVNQINGEYEVRKPDIMPYHRRAKALTPQFSHITVTHIARSLNSKADALASIAAAMAVPEGSYCEIPVKERPINAKFWDLGGNRRLCWQ
ncbi:hypothetical protein AAC387_Pa03g1777 [Persea americana]